MDIYLILTVLYVACCVLDFGFQFGHYQRKYQQLAPEEYKKDFIFCFIICLLGPVSLLTTLLLGHHKHGLKFK